MAASDVQQFWQQTIAEWQDSGLSGAASCKQQSLVYHRFVYWRRKLSVNAEQAPAPSVRISVVLDGFPPHQARMLSCALGQYI